LAGAIPEKDVAGYVDPELEVAVLEKLAEFFTPNITAIVNAGTAYEMKFVDVPWADAMIKTWGIGLGLVADFSSAQIGIVPESGGNVLIAVLKTAVKGECANGTVLWGTFTTFVTSFVVVGFDDVGKIKDMEGEFDTGIIESVEKAVMEKCAGSSAVLADVSRHHRSLRPALGSAGGRGASVGRALAERLVASGSPSLVHMEAAQASWVEVGEKNLATFRSLLSLAGAIPEKDVAGYVDPELEVAVLEKLAEFFTPNITAIVNAGTAYEMKFVDVPWADAMIKTWGIGLGLVADFSSAQIGIVPESGGNVLIAVLKTAVKGECANGTVLWGTFTTFVTSFVVVGFDDVGKIKDMEGEFDTGIIESVEKAVMEKCAGSSAVLADVSRHHRSLRPALGSGGAVAPALAERLAAGLPAFADGAAFMQVTVDVAEAAGRSSQSTEL